MVVLTVHQGCSSPEISCLKLTDFWIKKNECNIPQACNCSSRRCCRQTSPSPDGSRAAQHQFSGYIPAHPPLPAPLFHEDFQSLQQTGIPGTGSLLRVLNKGLENPTPKTLWEKEEPVVQEIREAVKCHSVTCCIGSVMQALWRGHQGQEEAEDLRQHHHLLSQQSGGTTWTSAALGQLWPSVGVFSNDRTPSLAPPACWHLSAVNRV